ncbi:MAG: hypothetical protein IT513_01050 [Burkholderiales bacterium]|nr:hypothetical protein [Burkholderiales bacterium]
MPSTSDLRTYSKQLLQAVQQLDALLDRASAAARSGGEVKEIAGQSQAILDALSKARSTLQAAAGGAPKATLDPAEARRETAVAVAELPLEPALQALREVPLLAEKAKAQPQGNAVLLVPLCLAYRHCLEALLPLAVAVDPRDLC